MAKTITPMHIYDLAQWKPVTPAVYLDLFGMVSMTTGEPTNIRTIVEDMEGYVRLVTFAELTPIHGQDEPVSVVEPYLMMLYSAEGGPNMPPKCFVRQRELSLP
jgi:hypothetical protein